MNDEDLIPQEEEAPAAWYISWADMVTILLTFFILIFTFSTISENKFVEATSSIQRAFGMPIAIGVPIRPDLDADRTAEEIHAMVEKEALDGVLVQDFGDRVVVSMDTDVAFAAGSADLTPKGRSALERLRPALESAPGEIRVEGHTCDLPVSAGKPVRGQLGTLHGTGGAGPPGARPGWVPAEADRRHGLRGPETPGPQRRRREPAQESARGIRDREKDGPCR